MLVLVPGCRAPYSWEVEDTGSFEPGWNLSVKDNVSAGTWCPWKYQTQAELRARPVWGKLALYRGGGFVVELGPDLQNASRCAQSPAGVNVSTYMHTLLQHQHINIYIYHSVAFTFEHVWNN